ncbi:MAG: Unknown protein [uncultured Sulfurovum sp.]|uniref:Uncharacterized protein n=1 Tax=uncultured Sulfurovum sp. TaxID=269237 RepID=A0A6S6SHQ3_9BACT|nr:MAG: Unknown protein [uncultured Sulfurovum sp.]
MIKQGQKGSNILRHSYVAHLAIKNIDLADTAILLGHASKEVNDTWEDI